jgi:hypothetical protein
MNITDQNQSFINDLLESNTKKEFPRKKRICFDFQVSSKRRTKSILSDIFLRCLTSTPSNLIKSFIGYGEKIIRNFLFVHIFVFISHDSKYSDEYDIYLWYFLSIYTRCDYNNSSVRISLKKKKKIVFFLV